MNRIMESQIAEAEERLRTAMLISDVKVLDELLAPDPIFTNHLGQLLNKQDDLAAHRSGLLEVNELEASERHIQLHGEVAVVSVRMRISGTYDGGPASGDFRFTRVWALFPAESWRLIAAYSVVGA